MSDAQEVLYLDPWKLVPYTRNVKKHPQSHIDTLKALIQKYGFSRGNAIQVDKNLVIIAGHGRREAACQLALTDVPVVIRHDLSDDEVKRWRIEENKSVGLDYDVVVMREELAELMEVDSDPLMGFDSKEWDVLTEDLTGDLDTDQVLIDLGEEMERSRQQHETAVEKATTSQVPVGELLGFKHVPADQQRRFAGFMAEIEFRTRKTGLEAFMAFIDRCDIDLACPLEKISND